MRVFSVVSVMCVLLAASAVAEAQSTRRPDLNMFKRALRDPRQSLSVQGNLGASFYDTLIRPDARPEELLAPDHGWGSFASAALLYDLQLGRVYLNGSLGSYVTYYPDLPDPLRAAVYPGGGAQTGYSWQLGQKTTANVGGGVT